MNEASNFCNGECDGPPDPIDLPYIPGETNLNTKAMDLGALHYGGYRELDVHSLYGLMESKAIYKFFEAKGTRPFILSRSTFPTHGQYAHHWLGDNESTWDSLRYSIQGVLNT
jgi:alpha-glucosidase (family GH31 glycosyl hydrolase)